MTRRTIGIDLAIRGDQVAQIFDDGRPIGRPIRFRIDATSLDVFVAKATEGLPAGATVQALMEPAGMSWFPIGHRLVEAGVEVIRVKGQRVRALRRYLSEHAKTDLADAHVLAAMPHFGGRGFDPVHIPSPKGHALQRLTKQRARFQDAVAGAKRRLLDPVRWASPGLKAVLPELRTIPGIGLHLASVLIGVLHTPARFRSERHIRGFCGLFPNRADSGGAERPGQKISQSGNNRIKCALILAADTARRIDPELAEVYWRLMTVRGHHHKQALCAVANRLVNRIFRVLRTGEPYRLRDLDGRKIDISEAKAIVAERYTVAETVRASRRVNRIQAAA